MSIDMDVVDVMAACLPGKYASITPTNDRISVNDEGKIGKGDYSDEI